MSRIFRIWFLSSLVVILSSLSGGRGEDACAQSLSEVKKPGNQDFRFARAYGTVTQIGKKGFSVNGRVDQPVDPQTYQGKLDLELSADLRASRFNPRMGAGSSYDPMAAIHAGPGPS